MESSFVDSFDSSDSDAKEIFGSVRIDWSGIFWTWFVCFTLWRYRVIFSSNAPRYLRRRGHNVGRHAPTMPAPISAIDQIAGSASDPGVFRNGSSAIFGSEWYIQLGSLTDILYINVARTMLQMHTLHNSTSVSWASFSGPRWNKTYKPPSRNRSATCILRFVGICSLKINGMGNANVRKSDTTFKAASVVGRLPRYTFLTALIVISQEPCTGVYWNTQRKIPTMV